LSHEAKENRQDIEDEKRILFEENEENSGGVTGKKGEEFLQKEKKN
jgi:hypothetical protein